MQADGGQKIAAGLERDTCKSIPLLRRPNPRAALIDRFAGLVGHALTPSLDRIGLASALPGSFALALGIGIRLVGRHWRVDRDLLLGQRDDVFLGGVVSVDHARWPRSPAWFSSRHWLTTSGAHIACVPARLAHEVRKTRDDNLPPHRPSLQSAPRTPKAAPAKHPASATDCEIVPNMPSLIPSHALSRGRRKWIVMHYTRGHYRRRALHIP